MHCCQCCCSFHLQPHPTPPHPTPACLQCCQCCCSCIFYTDVIDHSSGVAPETLYTLRTGLGCSGRVNNCCGATCLKPDLIIDVLDQKGRLVATVQKTYGGGDGCGAFCRCLFQADNFIVEVSCGVVRSAVAQ